MGVVSTMSRLGWARGLKVCVYEYGVLILLEGLREGENI